MKNAMNTPDPVLVFATQYMPTGGIESHLREFCQQLAASGAAIDLVVANSMMPPEAEAFFRRVCRRVYLGGHGRSNRRLLWLGGVGLRLAGRRYAALYTNGQGNSFELLTRLVPRRGRWVHHHHTAGDAADQTTWSPSYQRSLRVADAVVACARRNADDMQASLGRPVLSIPCFSRAVPASAPPPANPLRFGYYGRLIREKGIDALCQLSEEPELQDIEFHIWGEGEAYPVGFFAQYPRLRFHGAFSGRAGLGAVINGLDAYLLLSTNPEGLPIALLEVMSAGLPWLATDRGGIPDIACDPLATRLLPTTATLAEMKAAVLDLAADLRQGKVSRSAQQAQYAARFSAPVLVARWRDTLGLAPAAPTQPAPTTLAH